MPYADVTLEHYIATKPNTNEKMHWFPVFKPYNGALLGVVEWHHSKHSIVHYRLFVFVSDAALLRGREYLTYRRQADNSLWHKIIPYADNGVPRLSDDDRWAFMTSYFDIWLKSAMKRDAAYRDYMEIFN